MSLLVLAGVASFVVAVYVIVVLGGGWLIGHTSSPHLGLSALATAIVALAFDPARSWLERIVHRGRRPSPYEVLSRFSGAVGGSSTSGSVPARMAEVLGEGTGAEWAQVWVRLHDRLVLEATWPADARADPMPPGSDEPPGRRTQQVRHAGETLGVLRLQERDRQPLTTTEERLFAELAAQAGLVLHGVRLRSELALRLADLSARADELRIARERLVDTQDQARQRLERDIHDGAQQHLVALAVNLRLAQALSRRSPERAAQVLGEQARAARVAVETLEGLSRGIYPRLLSEEGIGPALRSALTTSPVPVELSADGVGRLPAGVEAAAYFCCLEAVQNAVKHAAASRIAVDVTLTGGTLQLGVSDNGTGFDPLSITPGSGLANMRDRIESVGGRISVRAPSGGGTSVLAWAPVSAAATIRTR